MFSSPMISSSAKMFPNSRTDSENGLAIWLMISIRKQQRRKNQRWASKVGHVFPESLSLNTVVVVVIEDDDGAPDGDVDVAGWRP